VVQLAAIGEGLAAVGLVSGLQGVQGGRWGGAMPVLGPHHLHRRDTNHESMRVEWYHQSTCSGQTSAPGSTHAHANHNMLLHSRDCKVMTTQLELLLQMPQAMS
jgi:hypothetical protein